MVSCVAASKRPTAAMVPVATPTIAGLPKIASMSRAAVVFASVAARGVGSELQDRRRITIRLGGRFARDEGEGEQRENPLKRSFIVRYEEVAADA
jgi:hypothetical protein